MRLRPSSSLIISVLGLITVIPSMLQVPIATASYSTATTDAFFLAMVVLTVVSAPLFNAVSSTLVPKIIEVRSASASESRELARSVMTYLALIGSVGTLLVAWAISGFAALQSDFLPDGIGLSVERFVWWLVPAVVLQTPSIVLEAEALAGPRPWIPALAGLARQTGVVILLWLFSKPLGEIGLPLSQFSASAVQILTLVVLTPGGTALCKPRLARPAAFREFLHVARPIGLGTLVMQLGPLISRIIAARFGTGVVTAIECSSRLTGAILDLSSSGLLATSFARWAKLSAAEDEHPLRLDYLDTLRIATYLIIPIAIGLIVVREPVLVFWLGRYNSNAAEIIPMASQLFAIFLLSVPIELAARLLIRLYLSTLNTRPLAILGSARVFLSICIMISIGPFLGPVSLPAGELAGATFAWLALLVWPTVPVHAIGRASIMCALRLVPAALVAWLFGGLAIQHIAGLPLFLAILIPLMVVASAYIICTSVMNRQTTLEATKKIQALLG